jgi:hypothetical protein
MVEKLIFKWFGGTIRARLSGYLVGGVLWFVAHVATWLSPQIAAMIDPNALAAILWAALLLEIKVVANKTHNQIVEDLQAALDGVQAPTIPVKRAEALR